MWRELATQFDALTYQFLNVARPVFAALSIKAERRFHVESLTEALGRKVQQFKESAVQRNRAQVLVDHRDALVDIVQRRLQDRPLLGEFALVLLQFGDVAGRADHANGTPFFVAHRHPVLARPAPGIIQCPVAIVTSEALAVSFEMFGNGSSIGVEIFRVDPVAPVLKRPHDVGGQAHGSLHAL